MRIRKVTAHAFGPLAGETLEFADGMTVVVGGNESAKSTWHAAIFAALCGRRRGPGRAREGEQRFIDLHKPWDRDNWVVSAELLLDDGRRIEMRQDLAGRVDCHAKDLDIGEDVSAQVMNEGTPDAACWLGLDRSSFAATAFVEQAQMLRVRIEADGLQQHLQRAAATAGADTTAAAALDRIRAFERDHVGLDRMGATKPLRQAVVGVQAAEDRLRESREAHHEYLRLVESTDRLRRAAQQTDAAVRAHEAATAADRAGKLAAQADRAAFVSSALGDAPPVSVAEHDALARQTSEALAAWRSKPPEPQLEGLTAEQIQAEIDALPPMPNGDLAVHHGVQRALEEMQRAETQFQQQSADRPAVPQALATDVNAPDGELLDLARTLEAPIPAADPQLAGQVDAARRELEALHAQTRTGNMILAAAAVAAIAGAALLAGVSKIAGAVLLAAAAALAVLGWSRRRGGDVPVAVRRHADLLAQLNEARRQAADASRRREEALQYCNWLGLSADPALLREIVLTRARAASYTQALRRWEERHRELENQVTAAARTLWEALSARAQPTASVIPGDLSAAVDIYRAQCGQRAEQAAEARRREILQPRLAARREAEQRADHDRRKRSDAAQQIAAAAAAAGLDPGEPEPGAGALEEWSRERSRQLERLGAAQNDWAELQALLGERSVDDLRQEAEQAARQARDLAMGVDPGLLAAVEPATTSQRLGELRREASEAREKAATAMGDLQRFAATVASVAEAEEALEAARTELDRVQELQQTLNLTRRFLENAQAQVHRNIAPVLRAALNQWLPTVTAGRYTDAMVNPTTLQVEVCGPSRRWRKADLLSYGTAEQIYLLLRIALADHLTRNHDTCPLILDDATVHADADRTGEILDLLLKVAQERQIILFTQENQVATWAQDNLTGPDHAVRKLTPVPVD